MLRQTGRDKGRGSAPVLGLGRATGARSALDLDETGAQAEIVGKGTDLLASNPGDARTAGELLDLGCEFAEFPGNGVGHGVSSSILDILSEGGSLGRLAMVHAQVGLFASSFFVAREPTKTSSRCAASGQRLELGHAAERLFSADERLL